MRVFQLQSLSSSHESNAGYASLISFSKRKTGIRYLRSAKLTGGSKIYTWKAEYGGSH